VLALAPPFLFALSWPFARDRNYAPGNTAILLSDLGIPISLFLLLISTGAIF
jgi:hypothetical protein